MPQDDCDALVVGGGIGGLAAAALLARKGFRTLLLERADAPGGFCRSVSKDRFTFDVGPNLLWGCGPGGHIRTLFETLDLSSDVFGGKLIRPVDPGIQVAFPRNRFNIFSQPSQLRMELERELERNATGVATHFPQLSRWEASLVGKLSDCWPGFLTSRSLTNPLRLPSKGRGRKHEPEGVGEKLLDCLTWYMGLAPLAETKSRRTKEILSIPAQGFCVPLGGAQSLTDILRESLEKRGGTINTHCEAKSLLTERGRVLGVKARFDVIEADVLARTVVLNAPLDGNPPTHAEHAGREGYVPFGIGIGIPETPLPELLGSTVLMPVKLTGQHPPSLLKLSVSPPWDSFRAPEGHRALTATVLLPASYWENLCKQSDATPRMVERLISLIERVIPFLSKYVVTLESFTPDYYESLTNRPHGLVTQAVRKRPAPPPALAKQRRRSGPLQVGSSRGGGHGVCDAVETALRAVKSVVVR